MVQEDAVMRTMRLKREKEQLQKQNQEQQAKGLAGGQGQTAVLPPLQAPTRVRRSRKLT
jgi:hypothetical protein